MRVRYSGAILISAALMIAGGCAKKSPEELPPPPMASGAQRDLSSGSGAPADEMDGLRRDFISQAGSDTVHFDTDSHMLDPAARATLDAQARWLISHPTVRVTIEGHCDERGTREYNLALGDRRANSAKNYLAARGVPATQMTTVSWGKERPVALGSHESAWEQNRRAVTVVPTG